MKQAIKIHIALILILSVVSCKPKETTDKWDDTVHSGIIQIACDENFKSLMEKEIQVFEGHFPEAVIFPVYTNETEAIRLLTSDSVRFALTTRDLYAKEKQSLDSLRMTLRKQLIAFDGVALIINALNKDSLLSIPQLKRILAGEITEWSQIRSSSSLGTVRLLVDSKESGILRYVIDSIADKNRLTANIYSLKNCTEVIEKVCEMPNAVGFVSLNALNALSDAVQQKIRLLRLSETEPATLKNSYLPYAGDLMQANYPFWRPIYVLLSDPKSGLSSGLSVFLGLEVGQKIIMQEGLLPVTDPQNREIRVIDAYP
ncbi:MAG: substrate-binding domain-containing protein [Dysgonamonadaceae bacterium]|nr:substrate-binding domain-containing protein [Dysgonamonadaceae bacterium]